MSPTSAVAISTFRYIISGLHVESDVELPSAIPHGFEDVAEITIRESHLPAAEDLLPDAKGTAFRFRVPEIGRFLMRNGRELLYETAPGHDPGLLPLHLTGICFATLLQQRGSIVLHASAVSVGGRAMLFCGESGAGKSTLAALLSDRGYPLLNDDVCSLTRNKSGGYEVHPDGRMLKLWAASLDQLHTPQRGAEVIGRTDKFYALPANNDLQAKPMGGLYLLHEIPSGEAPRLEPLSPARAMATLHDNAYRPELVRAMGQVPAYFQAAASLCSTVPVMQLSRPKDFSVSTQVLDLLEAAWHRSE